MLRCGVVEDQEDQIVRFYGGLRREIQDIVDYNEYHSIQHLFQLAIWQKKNFDRRLNPNLSRVTVNLIGGELDVDDPRLRTNRTPLHHCSVGYHPCHTNGLPMKAYPCKRNQEHKQEQEMQSNRLDYEVESHKPMNGNTV
jgi:hypothetical protein